jgi:hypothetical protein
MDRTRVPSTSDNYRLPFGFHRIQDDPSDRQETGKRGEWMSEKVGRGREEGKVGREIARERERERERGRERRRGERR